ncbi:MAG: Thymidine kinase [Dehalococcoidia bacterium]|nr:Thymidine kinase [Bacillota bacterium]
MLRYQKLTSPPQSAIILPETKIKIPILFSPERIEVIEHLVDGGKRVIVSGLDMDFAGRPFGLVSIVLALADEVMKLKAICMRLW